MSSRTHLRALDHLAQTHARNVEGERLSHGTPCSCRPPPPPRNCRSALGEQPVPTHRSLRPSFARTQSPKLEWVVVETCHNTQPSRAGAHTRGTLVGGEALGRDCNACCTVACEEQPPQTPVVNQVADGIGTRTVATANGSCSSPQRRTASATSIVAVLSASSELGAAHVLTVKANHALAQI